MFPFLYGCFYICLFVRSFISLYLYVFIWVLFSYLYICFRICLCIYIVLFWIIRLFVLLCIYIFKGKKQPFNTYLYKDRSGLESPSIPQFWQKACNSTVHGSEHYQARIGLQVVNQGLERTLFNVYLYIYFLIYKDVLMFVLWDCRNVYLYVYLFVYTFISLGYQISILLL